MPRPESCFRRRVRRGYQDAGRGPVADGHRAVAAYGAARALPDRGNETHPRHRRGSDRHDGRPGGSRGRVRSRLSRKGKVPGRICREALQRVPESPALPGTGAARFRVARRSGRQGATGQGPHICEDRKDKRLAGHVRRLHPAERRRAFGTRRRHRPRRRLRAVRCDKARPSRLRREPERDNDRDPGADGGKRRFYPPLRRQKRKERGLHPLRGLAGTRTISLTARPPAA